MPAALGVTRTTRRYPSNSERTGLSTDSPRMKMASSKSGGQGFGKGPSSSPRKTYTPQETTPLRDMIDSEAAMNAFFNSREEWFPLFRSLSSISCEANEILSSAGTDASFQTETPWKQFQDKPTEESHLQLLSGFLDSMQQSLLDIPVTESSSTDDNDYDDNDMHFVEEGRRLLAISRFHVVDAQQHDDLFIRCWSEMKHLVEEDVQHTGSLILVPDMGLADLRRFVDMNVQRPLTWLGSSITGDFEIATLHRSTAAVRILYKLNEIPTDTSNENDE